MYNVQSVITCTTYNVVCTLYNVHCTLYNVQYIMHKVLSTRFNVHHSSVSSNYHLDLKLSWSSI